MSEKVIDLKKFRERRKYKRYRVRAGVFSVLRPADSSAKLGSVVDIALGGLAFQYYSESRLSLDAFTEIDIHVSGDGVYVAQIPIQIISDLSITEGDPFYSSTLKRYGVQFGDLTAFHQRRLNAFIKNYTDGE